MEENIWEEWGLFFGLRFEMSTEEAAQEMSLPPPVCKEDEEREVDVLRWMLKLLIEATSQD